MNKHQVNYSSASYSNVEHRDSKTIFNDSDYESETDYESATYENNHSLQFIKNGDNQTETMDKYINVKDIPKGKNQSQHTSYSLQHFRSKQKHFTSINASTRTRRIIGKDGAMISKSKSLSSPELARRSKTCSEKDEEHDKVCK